jgi:hypothetical protein
LARSNMAFHLKDEFEPPPLGATGRRGGCSARRRGDGLRLRARSGCREAPQDKAAEQQALFVTKKFDPGAPTYSLDFLRKHPEISTESVPWHMHTNGVHDMKGPIAGAQ